MKNRRAASLYYSLGRQQTPHRDFFINLAPVNAHAAPDQTPIPPLLGRYTQQASQLNFLGAILAIFFILAGVYVAVIYFVFHGFSGFSDMR
jgi:hypothetical protein